MTYELPDDDGAWTRLDGWDRVATGLRLYSLSVQAYLMITAVIIVCVIMALFGSYFAGMQTLLMAAAVGYVAAQLVGVVGLVFYSGLHQASGAKGMALAALGCLGLVFAANAYVLLDEGFGAVAGVGGGLNIIMLVAAALFYIGVLAFLRSAGRLSLFVDRLDLSHKISNVTTVFGGIFFLDVFRVAIISSVRGVIGFHVVMSLLVLCLMIYGVIQLALVTSALGKAIRQDVDTVGAFD